MKRNTDDPLAKPCDISVTSILYVFFIYFRAFSSFHIQSMPLISARTPGYDWKVKDDASALVLSYEKVYHH